MWDIIDRLPESFPGSDSANDALHWALIAIAGPGLTWKVRSTDGRPSSRILPMLAIRFGLALPRHLRVYRPYGAIVKGSVN